MTTTTRIAAALICAAATAPAFAQTPGSWSFKAGANTISPKVKSGDLSAPSLPGSKIDIDAATSAIITATYQWDAAMSVELYAGLPYEHDVKGAGAIAGFGTIATVKQVAPTVFAQYRFLDAGAALRPYVGLGLTYAYFYGEEGSAALTALTNPGGAPTRVSAKSAWGLSPQVGVSVPIAGGRWYVDASVIKSYIKSTATLSSGQSVDVKLDPVSANVSVGYRF